MTNKEAKTRAFREAAARWNATQTAKAKKNPAKAAYKAGRITWNEYLKQSAADEDYRED